MPDHQTVLRIPGAVRALSWQASPGSVIYRRDMVLQAQWFTFEADKMIAHMAFHWYSGDPFGAVCLVPECLSNKPLIFSEGYSEYSRFNKAQAIKNAQVYAHDIIRQPERRYESFFGWNIALNKESGPN